MLLTILLIILQVRVCGSAVRSKKHGDLQFGVLGAGIRKEDEHQRCFSMPAITMHEQQKQKKNDKKTRRHDSIAGRRKKTLTGLKSLYGHHTNKNGSPGILQMVLITER